MSTQSDDVTTSFPQQYARTQRFSLGAPRVVNVAADGSRAAFLRTRSGTERAGCLWLYDVEADEERIIADPDLLLAPPPGSSGEASSNGEELSREELARRERTREGGAGIVAYDTDAAVTRAVFALSSRLYLAELNLGPAADHTSPGATPVRQLPARTPVVDPRLDPLGTQVAYVSGGALRIIDIATGDDHALLEPSGPDITWGLAEFIAAEEMDRFRGFWWSPDGDHLLVARVDQSPVQRWHIADPAQPDQQPIEVAYPAAGTANADASLALVEVESRKPVEVVWDREAFPYLARARWSSYGPPLLLVQSRDQRTTQILKIDVETGKTELLREQTDPAWVDIVSGVPAWSADGRLITTVNDDDTRRLVIDGRAVTPVGLQVAGVLSVDDREILISATEEPTDTHIWSVGTDDSLSRITNGSGRHFGGRSGDMLVLSRASMEQFGSSLRLLRKSPGDPDAGKPGAYDIGVHEFESFVEKPVLTPRVTFGRAARGELRTALLLPTGWERGSEKLPVLMDPYGGPEVQRVITARNAYLSSQWLADQGFAVLIADGRGTPARGPSWSRSVAYDLAGPILEDQIDALHATAEEHDYLDLKRVAIRGWSFGGYLAALAVLRRPDVFAAAIAGAPVTDWSLYDTHYTERYLGTPQEQPEAYERSSLLADAHRLERPLMLIHGLSDDNVVAAHTLRLSSALLAAGRPHTVVPLSGVTHMTPQDVVAENLLHVQIAFLKDALGMTSG